MYSYSTDCTVQTKKELATYIAHTCFQQTIFYTHSHEGLNRLYYFLFTSQQNNSCHGYATLTLIWQTKVLTKFSNILEQNFTSAFILK